MGVRIWTPKVIGRRKICNLKMYGRRKGCKLYIYIFMLRPVYGDVAVERIRCIKKIGTNIIARETGKFKFNFCGHI